MEQVFELLFKYEPIVFLKGDMTFITSATGGWPLWLGVGLLTLVVMAYFKQARVLSLKLKLGLASLRLGVLLILLVCLLQPAIRIPTVVPQASFAAVVVDDSQSMQIADEVDGRRVDVAQRLLSPSHPFWQKLEEKFRIRRYIFSSTPRRADVHVPLTASGQSTNMAAAIDLALDDLHDLPLSAIVVMSDGANNVSADFSSLITKLKARRVPLYVVGLGREVLDHDLELVKVDAPRAVLQGSSISASLTLKGRPGRQVPVHVLEGQRLLQSQRVWLKGGGQVQNITVTFTPTGAGLKHYVVTVPPQPDELITENNQGDVVVMVRDEHPRILYVEGEPRWEYGKLRAALRDEKNLILSSLLRTAKNKYYRQGIETPDQLSQGFPRSREELFTYKGIILGSIEATFFSFDQLKNLEAFVAERGGGLLMLGGRHALSQGGYGSTPLADVLPVVLTEATAPVTVKPSLTLNGRLHPVTQLSEEVEANIQIWDKLPALTVSESLTTLKPGAVVLVEGRAGGGQPVVLLSYQRYGRGRSLVFTAVDSWRWQMQMPSNDHSHERFWTQLLRYLVSDVPDQVTVMTDQDAYDISDLVRLRAEVNDRTFNPVREATVIARVRRPSGQEDEVRLEWMPDEGQYVGQVVAREPGLHTLELVARSGEDTIGRADAGFIVGHLNREYRDAHQHGEFLRHLAQETGGRYYTSDTAARLPEEIIYLDNPSSRRVTKELWDMPINFLLLIGLVSAEWLLRKRMGLV